MLLKIIAVAFFLGCSLVQLKAELPKSHITDLGLVYGNVKYYYPNKKVKEADWNKLLAYILKSWEADSNALKHPADFHNYLVKKYLELGIKINLYEQKPASETNPDIIVKGKHWQYKGYPFSRNKYLIGLAAPFYNVFLNPYSKSLKRNSSDYLLKISKLPQLSFSKNELLVQLRDSLWLGLPWKGTKEGQSEGFKVFTTPTDFHDGVYKLVYVMDEWNVLYHFSPTLENKGIWLARLLKATDEVLIAALPFEVAEKLLSPTNDAHTNFVSNYILPGDFYKIDTSYYYRKAKNDSSTIRAWRVLLYNGVTPDKIYNANLLKVASPSQLAKSYFALRKMAAPEDTAAIKLLVQNIGSTDTFSFAVHGKFSMADPGSDHSQGKAKAVNPDLGIYYIDLKNATSKNVLKILGSPACKAAIIDIRGHPNLDDKFLKSLITLNRSDISSVMPLYSFPDKNSVVYDTVLNVRKPSKNPIDKPLAVLCDESSISYSENLLATFHNCTKAVIIGRHSAGTTGNMAAAPIIIGHGRFDIIPFTPVFFLNTDGTRFCGIAPDIEVAESVSGLKNGEDKIFNAAQDYLIKLMKH